MLSITFHPVENENLTGGGYHGGKDREMRERFEIWKNQFACESDRAIYLYRLNRGDSKVLDKFTVNPKGHKAIAALTADVLPIWEQRD